MAPSNPNEGDRFASPWDFTYSNPEHIPRSYLTGEELRAMSGENKNQTGNLHHHPLNARNSSSTSSQSSIETFGSENDCSTTPEDAEMGDYWINSALLGTEDARNCEFRESGPQF